MLPSRLRYAIATLVVAAGALVALAAEEPISLGSRRELLIDHFLIEKLDGAALQLQQPQPAGTALVFDRPWEGALSGYVTIIHDGDRYRMYYRGRPLTGYGDTDARAREVTCYAESADGITFTRPNLGLVDLDGSRDNNVILAGVGPETHNFAPFLDTRPGVPQSERFKAVGGNNASGLIGYVSADGIHFHKLQDAPIITGGAFDSQNNVLWSDHERCYVCYFRTFKNGVRWITRTTSTDFLHWTPAVDLTFGEAPHEHLYTNQMVAYFGAPHVYVGTAARFWPGRRSLTDEQVAALQLDKPANYPGLKRETSDAVLLSSRGGERCDRTFLESLVRPGVDLKNWTARSNYPARGVVPTGPAEMSLYVQRHYGQPTHFLERLTLRTDGFAAVHVGYAGGELLTRPFTFNGRQLTLNLSTSAAGGVLVEIQDAAGHPIAGYTLADCLELNTDDLARVVTWKGGDDLSALANKPIRLRFRLKDADLFALQFVP